MLIHAAGAILNVTEIDKITVDHDSDNKWFCRLVYTDGKGRDSTYMWQGANNMRDAVAVQTELLKQIREVELEKMSTLLEDAITKA